MGTANPNNLPATKFEWTAADGMEIVLTLADVKQYLVQGHKDQVTDQEFMYFVNICKARKLNPWIKDCYLIKYGSDPAAIVTSIDFFRKRSRSQPDCKGWKRGIIVMGKDGNIKDSLGLITEGETLLGGFFEAKPAGWDEKFRHEVNLKGYIKTTKEGNVTKFWAPANQPSQIMKVAESQGLRLLWPDEFQQMYTDAEISEDVDRPPALTKPEIEDELTQRLRKFEEQIPEGTNREMLDKYIEACVEHFKKTSPDITADQVKINATENPKSFYDNFKRWLELNTPKDKKKKPEPPKMVKCPNREDKEFPIAECDQCGKRDLDGGCPEYKRVKG